MLQTLRVTCVSVSAAPVFIYLLRPSQPVSSFLGNVLRTARQHCDPCFSHGQIYVTCSRVGNPTNIYIPAPEGKTKKFSDISNRRWYSNFVKCLCFLLIVEEGIVFIHDAAFFFLQVCAFAYVMDRFVRNMAHISVWYISTIYSVPTFCYIIHKIAIRFRHWPSRVTPGTPACKNIVVFWLQASAI